jgi:hypothetical protein
LEEPEKVFLAGDWHGNREWAVHCFRSASAAGCPVMLQLGDFGLWPGREEAWLDHVQSLAADFNVEFFWIDGNHENHDWLDGCGTGLVSLRPAVTWVSRGTRWEWSGVRFGALGGAVSIDRFLRRAGVNWWPQEIVSEEDVKRLGDGELDVLVSHASPVPAGRPLRLPRSIADDVRSVRVRIASAVANTRPRLVVHGHHHIRHTSELSTSRIEGFSRDGATGAYGVLYLDKGADLAVRTPAAPEQPLRAPASAASQAHCAQSGGSARG